MTTPTGSPGTSLLRRLLLANVPAVRLGIGVAFHVWDVYAPETPPEDRIRREMDRLSH
jgi:hypothetical protein